MGDTHGYTVASDHEYTHAAKSPMVIGSQTTPVRPVWSDYDGPSHRASYSGRKQSEAIVVATTDVCKNSQRSEKARTNKCMKVSMFA